MKNVFTLILSLMVSTPILAAEKASRNVASQVAVESAYTKSYWCVIGRAANDTPNVNNAFVAKFGLAAVSAERAVEKVQSLLETKQLKKYLGSTNGSEYSIEARNARIMCSSDGAVQLSDMDK